MKKTLYRLRKNREFQRVFKKGRKIPGRYTLLFYRRNNKNYNRFGFTISKKVGKSVRRNRIKRLYFEVLRHMEQDLQKGYDFVVVARRKATEMDYHGAQKDLKKILDRAQMWESKERKD